MLLIVLVAIIGITVLMKHSYAYLYTTLRGEKTYSLKVKGFSLRLDDSKTSGNVSLQNSTPVSDSVGKTSNAYTFSVINEDTSQTGYVIYLDDVGIDDEINRMKDMNIKYQLIENGVEHVGLVSELGANPFRILTNGIINGKTTNNYSLRFWIKENAEIPTGQSFSVKVRVVATSPDAINEGKLIFGETIVTSDSGVTQMTSDQLQTYVDRALGNRIETKLNEQAKEFETKLNEKERELLDKNHPVGSIYITEKNTNPSELFGGTWEKYASGRTLVGIDSNNTDFNTIGKKGGSSTASLEVDNLASHSHTIDHTHKTATATISSSGAHTHTTAAKAVSDWTTSNNGSHNHISYWVSGYDGWSGNVPEGYYAFRHSTTVFANSNLLPITGKSNVMNTTADGNHTHTVSGTIPALSIASSGAHAHTVPELTTKSISTTNSGDTGSGKPFSVQDPYITVYMWKRVS